MKSLAWICLVAFFTPLQLMAQDPDALRKERDKLTERGMWREALNLYGEKLMPISDEKSDLDLRMAVEVIRGQNVWGEFDELAERAISTHPDNAMLLVQAAAVRVALTPAWLVWVCPKQVLSAQAITLVKAYCPPIRCRIRKPSTPFARTFVAGC